MPDPMTQQPTIDAASELAVLKPAHQELLTKRQRDKARITELESASATLQADLEAARIQVREVTVGQPLKALAQSVSTVPDMWMKAFNDHFNVESKDGVLVISDKAGKAVNGADGKPLKFDEDAIKKHLTESEPDSERTKLFRLIMIGSKASGSAGFGMSRPAPVSKPSPKGSQVGLGRKL